MSETPEAQLAWPPPGLEPARGAASLMARRFGVASATIVAPILAAMALGGDALAASDARALVALGAVTLLGAALMLRALAAAWSFAGTGGDAVLRGYTWLTVIEVAADHDGRTGTLIAGTADFAEHGPDRRFAGRVARLLAAAAGIGAALAPIPALLVVSRLGNAGVVGLVGGFALFLAPSLVLLAIRRVLLLPERRAARAGTAAQERTLRGPGAGRRIVDPWYAAFESAREGQALGRGPRGGALRAWLLGGVATAGVLAATAAMLPLALVTLAAPAAFTAMAPEYGGTVTRIANAERMRPFAAPVDSSIAPLAAGEAFMVMQSMYGFDASPPLRPRQARFGGLPAAAESLFRGGRGSGWAGPNPQTVLRRAATGFTRAEMAYLDTLEAHPVWAEYRTVARSRAVYIVDAAFETPLPDTLWTPALPILRFAGTKELAYASTARAARLAALGRHREAELALMETVSFGLHIIDAGTSTVDALIGSVVVNIGRDGLLDLYTMIDHPDLARVRDIATSSVPPSRARLRNASRRELESALADGELPRAVRWDLVESLSISACGSVGDMLFADPDRVDSSPIKRARARLSRTLAERALFDAKLATLERARYAPASYSPDKGAARGAERLISHLAGLLGSDRLRQCARLTLWAQLS